MSAFIQRYEENRGRNLCMSHYVGQALIILWCQRRFVLLPPLSYRSLSRSLSLCACVCLSLYLLFPSSLPLCNGISIGQIATGIQYGDHLIESLIGCLMSACLLLVHTDRGTETATLQTTYHRQLDSSLKVTPHGRINSINTFLLSLLSRENILPIFPLFHNGRTSHFHGDKLSEWPVFIPLVLVYFYPRVFTSTS